MGHPAPEWIECDHEDEEECSCDEENDRLRGQWMAEQELYAATCDFHAPVSYTHLDVYKRQMKHRSAA